jgi:radical SAM protein with 4Fe4S-binding SPASM domain
MNLRLLPRYASAFISYWIGKTHLRYPPLFYSIEATNICNYRCTYCPQGNPQGENFRKGRMSIELYEHILKQISRLKPVSQVYLTGSGEPLMHPQLERFVSLANQYGFVPNFSSNGSLFSEERCKSLMNSGRFSLTVDFSPNREIYESFRSGGNWETVYLNLKALLLLKKNSKGNYPNIEIRDMSTIGLNSPREMEKSLSDLKGLFKNQPVDRYSQLKVHTWTGNIDPKITPARVKGKRYKLCTHPWSIFVITYSGEVLACCRDFGSEYVIGRLDGEEGILDIWNNQRIKSLRKALAKKRPHRINICKNCDRPLTGGSVAKSKPEMIKKILWEKIASGC